MKRVISIGAAGAALSVMTACSGGGQGGGGGWFFPLVLVVLLVVILVKLFRESEATSDSLISIEGQLRRLNNKLDELTEGSSEGGGSKKTPAKKTTAKKTSSKSSSSS